MSHAAPRSVGSADPIESASPTDDRRSDRRRTPKPGTAAAAYRHGNFRTLFLGAFATNIGTWMQNVVLGALAWELTRDKLFVGFMMAAQLGPLLVFSIIGGMIADSFDRRRSLTILSLQQAVFSILIGVVALPASPNRWLLLLMVFGVGVGHALYSPILSAVLPIMVPRRDIGGAIALNSIQMNASRVIGPIIGTFLYARYGPSWVFFLNALCPAMVITALTRVTLPEPVPSDTRGFRRIAEGLQIARADRVIRKSLVTVFLFSLVSLPFISQMPAIAGEHLGIDADSTAYGMLYAGFGTGAIIGALLVGSVFAHTSKATLTRFCLVGFAIMLTIFGSLRAAAPAYAVIVVLGAVYFSVITSLSTALQENLDDSLRGKVLALWIMGFGGTVPFGGIAGGGLMNRFGIFPVLVLGALMAIGLAVYADLRPHPDADDPAIDDEADPDRTLRAAS